MIIDIHIHSNRSQDNTYGPTPYQIYHQLNKRGINGAAITDHDHLMEVDSSVETAFDLVIVPGMEYSAREGHILLLGKFTPIKSELPLERFFEKFHSSNCVVIAAHPYDSKYGLGDVIYEYSHFFDGIEINGRRSKRVNGFAKTLAKEVDLPLVGGSDAHNLDQIGNIVTEFLVPIRSWQDCVSGIREGECNVKYLRK